MYEHDYTSGMHWKHLFFADPPMVRGVRVRERNGKAQCSWSRAAAQGQRDEGEESVSNTSHALVHCPDPVRRALEFRLHPLQNNSKL